MCLGGGLQKEEMILLGKSLSLLVRNLSSLFQVLLVTNENNYYLLNIQYIFDFFGPFADISEAFSVSNIIDQEDYFSLSKVASGEVPVPFLASCVPDLYFVLFALKLNLLKSEVYSDSRLGILPENVLIDPGEEVGLADCLGANEDCLDYLVVFLTGVRVFDNKIIRNHYKKKMLEKVLRSPQGNLGLWGVFGLVELGIARVELIVHLHNCCLVSTSIAVVWSRENSDYLGLVVLLVPSHYQLVGSRDHGQVVFMQKLLGHVRAELVAGRAGRGIEAFLALLWVRPK